MLKFGTLGWRLGHGLAVAVVTMTLTACGGDEGGSSQPSSSGSPASSSDTGSSSGSTATTAKALAVSGSPSTEWTPGMSYTFQPSASDPEGDPLTFKVQNLPTWATFNESTGKLTGTPADSDIGVHANIRISVSDGKNEAALPTFSIDVRTSADGRATLYWDSPTSNSDGSALTNLAGYRVLYGTDPKSLSEEVRVDNPSVTTYVVDNLPPATWYFAVKAFTSTGTESVASDTASKQVM